MSLAVRQRLLPKGLCSGAGCVDAGPCAGKTASPVSAPKSGPHCPDSPHSEQSESGSRDQPVNRAVPPRSVGLSPTTASLRNLMFLDKIETEPNRSSSNLIASAFYPSLTTSKLRRGRRHGRLGSRQAEMAHDSLRRGRPDRSPRLLAGRQPPTGRDGDGGFRLRRRSRVRHGSSVVVAEQIISSNSVGPTPAA